MSKLERPFITSVSGDECYVKIKVKDIEQLHLAHDITLETFKQYQNVSSDPAKALMDWATFGPKLAVEAGLYVGIKIYESKEHAEKLGDI